MNCDRARSAMLEASTTVLRGEGEGAIVAHLGQCADCAAIALEMARAQAQLHHALDDLAATHDVGETLTAVHARLLDGEGRTLPIPAVKWRSAASVLAAAAVVTALAVWRDDVGERTRPAPTAMDVVRLVTATQRPRDAPPPAGQLAVESDQRFALMKTDKPTISVVWFY